MLLAAVLAVAVVATACVPAAPWAGASGGIHVGVVGDSLTWQIQSPLATGLVTSGYRASVTGAPGFTTGGLIPTARELTGATPDVLVVATGTNDFRTVAAGEATWDTVRQGVKDMLAATRSVPCLVWVGINTTSGWWGPPGSSADQAVTGWVVNWIINEEIARSGRAAGTTRYADWSVRSQGRGEYFLAPGDVHLSPAGQTAYQALVRENIDACAQSLKPQATAAPKPDLERTQSRLDVTSVSNAPRGVNSFAHYDLTSVTSYTAQSGDRLVYDVQHYTANAKIAIDLVTKSNQTLSSSGAVDQNGLAAQAATGLDAHAYGRWYERTIALPAAWTGQVIERFLVATEADATVARGALRNARIVAADGTTRFVIYAIDTPRTMVHASANRHTALIAPVPAR